VEGIFLAEPEVPAVYGHAGVLGWKQRKASRLLRIERIENKHQEQGALSRYHGIADDIKTSGLPFTGGVHTRWLFHASSKVEEIVRNPVKGFVELAGERFLWGKGAQPICASLVNWSDTACTGESIAVSKI
jgi:hypothetical protein